MPCRKIIAFFCFLFSAFEAQSQPVQDKKFSGSLVCQDCEGIRTNLILFANYQYQITLIYQGKSDIHKTIIGKFNPEKNGRIHLLYLADTLFSFRPNGANLTMVSLGNDFVWSDASGNNTLYKNPNCTVQQQKELSGTWQLIKVDEKEFKSFSFEGIAPQLTFTPEDLRVEGNTGCNDLFGSFSLKNNHIFFSNDIVTTRMFCEHSAEQFFLLLLRQINRYERRNSNLLLISNEGKTMEFELFKQ